MLIALGANKNSRFGDPSVTVLTAISHIRDKLGAVSSQSALYKTPCFPIGAGPDYVNAAISLQTDLSARQVLAGLHDIEADFGRERIQRWGQRVIDLDLLAAGGLIFPDRTIHAQWRDLPLAQQMQDSPDQMILPHPRIQDRSFVLVPLMDVAPDWIHPILGLSVAQMLAVRPADERDQVVQIP